MPDFIAILVMGLISGTIGWQLRDWLQEYRDRAKEEADD
jgi:hypothetical protein